MLVLYPMFEGFSYEAGKWLGKGARAAGNIKLSRRTLLKVAAPIAIGVGGPVASSMYHTYSAAAPIAATPLAAVAAGNLAYSKLKKKFKPVNESFHGGVAFKLATDPKAGDGLNAKSSRRGFLKFLGGAAAYGTHKALGYAEDTKKDLSKIAKPSTKQVIYSASKSVGKDYGTMELGERLTHHVLNKIGEWSSNRSKNLDNR